MNLAEAARLALVEAQALAAVPWRVALQRAHRALVECRGEPDRAALLALAGWALRALAAHDGDEEPAPALNLAAIRERAARAPGTWRSEAGHPVGSHGYAERVINRCIINGPLCFRRKKGRTDAEAEAELVAILRDIHEPAYAAQADRVALLAEVFRLRAEVERLIVPPIKIKTPAPPAVRCARCGDKIKAWGEWCWQIGPDTYLEEACADEAGSMLPRET